MLEPSVPNAIPEPEQPPPPPVEVGGDAEFEVTDILDSKIDNRHCMCKILYLVKWAGYEGTDKETSWLLAMELGHAVEIVTDFMMHTQTNPGLLALYKLHPAEYPFPLDPLH
jgi:hypothetical protein